MDSGVTEPFGLRAASQAVGETTDSAESALGSGGWLMKSAPVSCTVVTWCEGGGCLTVGFLVVRWGLGWPSIGVSA